MSHLVVKILCRNYEDYERVETGGNAFAGWPDMWPEERYAEGALYREWKERADRHTYEVANGIYTPPPPPSERQPEHDEESPKTLEQVIVMALLSIVREQGWHVRNAHAVRYLGVNPVYAIDPDEETPTWEDSAPLQFTMSALKQRVKAKHFANRIELQEYALVTLARENKWEKNEPPYWDSNQKRVYRIG